MEGSRPGRGSSFSPSSRAARNRLRHFATVPSRTPNSAATPTFEPQAAHSNTIFERNASDCADEGRLAHRSSLTRSASVSTRFAFGRPVRGRSGRPSRRSAMNLARRLLTVSPTRRPREQPARRPHQAPRTPTPPAPSDPTAMTAQPTPAAAAFLLGQLELAYLSWQVDLRPHIPDT